MDLKKEAVVRESLQLRQSTVQFPIQCGPDTVYHYEQYLINILVRAVRTDLFDLAPVFVGDL
jgi:hypothetical protein